MNTWTVFKLSLSNIKGWIKKGDKKATNKKKQENKNEERNDADKKKDKNFKTKMALLLSQFCMFFSIAFCQ